MVYVLLIDWGFNENDNNWGLANPHTTFLNIKFIKGTEKI